MAKKSKWVVVATEGATTDGRTIQRNWISEMAANYDPKKYGARVNLEHIKWRYMWNDDPHSKCYGDVIGLKTEENAEGKLQLLAQIDPTDDLIKLNKDRQKIYTSIECDPNFADTGEAYLVGLAVTDNPASLGTEMLVFSAGASANPLNNRKKTPITFSLQPLKLNWNLWKKHKASLKKSKACLRKKKNQTMNAFLIKHKPLSF